MTFTARLPKRGHYNLWAIVLFVLLCLYIKDTAAQTVGLENARAWCKRSAEPTAFVSQSKSDFSIKVPDYLIEVDDLSEDAEMQFRNIVNETYLLISSERTFSNGTGEQLLKTQELFEAKLRETGAVIEHAQRTTINGHPSLQFEVVFVADGHALSYLVTFIEAPGKLFKIYNWTLAENKALYFPDFHATALSFNTHSITVKR